MFDTRSPEQYGLYNGTHVLLKKAFSSSSFQLFVTKLRGDIYDVA